ncbi:MAG: MucR family transcriptional regulator [Bacilli bacterium]|nr:MucR family transcriptional regulator [Bacilli bacterium]MBQ3307688.1 MucR family transcriptional regulator [Bacilli bacterium]
MKCLICGKECKNLEAHIRRLHKISKEEYKVKYNYDGPFMISMSDEAKAKMIEKKKGKTPWNKGLTKETDSRIKSTVGRKITEEQKALISKRTKEAMQRPEVKEKLKEIHKNFHTERPEVRRKIAEASIKHWEDGAYANKCANNRFGVKTEYNGILFRSKTEAKFAKYFDDNNIKYEYENYIFKYKQIDGLEHNYRPDFYLPEYDIFIEVKSKIVMTNLVKAKLESVKSSGKRIIIADLKMLPQLKYIL